MEFKEYSKAVMAWVDGVMQNRGADAEKTLKYCADIEQYAKQTGDPKLLGFAYYYAGETYYVLNEGEQLLKTITRAITYLDQAEQWDMVARAYNILAIAFLNRGNTPIALDYYLTGLGYCKKYKLANEENVINLNLGTLYLGNEQWNEAQRYFEKVSSDIKAYPETPNYYGLMSCVAVCLGRCFMQREQNERVQAQMDYLDQVCWEHMQKIERLSALIFKAEYYHHVGRITLREECIEQIRGLVDMDMAVMDIFDDVYGLCRLLLEIDKEDVFWDIVAVLEKLTKNANIANLQRKIVSLKILCYRRKQDEAAYLEEAGRFYELTEALDRENHYMIANMLSVRRSLEHANEKRREMEKANERLLEKSETDPLTRLANRFRLNDYLERAFERTRDDHRAFAVGFSTSTTSRNTMITTAIRREMPASWRLRMSCGKCRAATPSARGTAGMSLSLFTSTRRRTRFFPWRTVCGSVFLTGGSSMCARRRFRLSQSRRESVLTWLRREAGAGISCMRRI